MEQHRRTTDMQDLKAEKNLRRRASDRTMLMQLQHILLNGDISMTLLLGGAGLIIWAIGGMFAFRQDMLNFTNLFEIGSTSFWLANYILCGLGLWYVAAKQLPPLASLLVGSWTAVVWTWIGLARATMMPTMQTGVATSAIYVLLGILLIHRSAKGGRGQQ